MGRNIKKLEFKILLFVLTFLFSLACFAGNKQIIAGPSSGIDFMTNGENTRMSIDSTGDISASGDFTMLNGSIFGATFDGTSLSLADSVLGNKVTFLAEDSTANYSIVLPAANCSSGEGWQWDGSGKPQCVAGAAGIGGTGAASEVMYWSGASTATGDGNFTYDESIKQLQITSDTGTEVTFKTNGQIMATGDYGYALAYGEAGCQFNLSQTATGSSWQNIAQDTDCSTIWSSGGGLTVISNYMGAYKYLYPGLYRFRIVFQHHYAVTGCNTFNNFQIGVCAGTTICSDTYDTADYKVINAKKTGNTNLGTEKPYVTFDLNGVYRVTEEGNYSMVIQHNMDQIGGTAYSSNIIYSSGQRAFVWFEIMRIN